MQYLLKDASNQEIGSVELSEAVFGRPLRGDLLSLAVTYQLAGRRLGTASSKTRAEVRGGGRKPYRQKGTGNARQGTIRAPHYRKGGVVFGPRPHDHAIRLPKKVRRLALQTALSAKIEAGEVVILDRLSVEGIKTRVMRQLLIGLGVEKSALVVLAERDQNVELSSRNLPGITVMPADGVNVYDLLVHEKLVLTESARLKLEERLA
ncbi:MAG: 50S ribosomal protein L4 [Magnetococcales bacterium]|nr:50S ribosomal protein L4 [Magnetococcales bacterium]